MLEYIQLYPETIAAVRRYPAADRALLYEAMAAYGIEGTAPDWPEDDLKWLVWESLRQRVDLAARKSETNRNNRKRNTTNDNEPERNETTANEPERNETNNNEPERNETNRNHQSESESESEPEPEADPETVTPERDTHTDPQQGDSAGARACEGGQGMIVDELHAFPCPMPRTFTPPEVRVIPPGWYNPADPDAPFDASWLGSQQARKSIAQRILDHVIRRRIITPEAVTAESGRAIGREIMDALQAAMAAGKSPRECQRLAQDARALWVWEIRLKEIALAYGTAPPAMADLWWQDVTELGTDAEDVALNG